MNRVIFNHPFLLGFDHLERMLEQASKSGGEGYPPFDIEQLASDHVRISVAVAGFAQTDLAVSVEDNQLVIRGRRPEGADEGKTFIHKGIAMRQFVKTFLLAEGMEVSRAGLGGGLLHIDVKRVISKPTVNEIAIEDEENVSGK
ncbi:hypothetical protein FACS1894186_6000 [Alphaproteobacteria bacterium]|nr:hypothetical protein FACS1894186_6000 [Alphaproteobacteria bacterium]